MTYLLLSIGFSACLPLLFKAFSLRRVQVAWAIPANYLTCVVLGAALSAPEAGLVDALRKDWLGLAALQGVCLAGTFYLLAFTAQRSGVAVAALASRLSVAVPVAVGFWAYGEAVGIAKGLGLAAALLALYLSSYQATDALHTGPPASPWAPAIVFLAFGFHFTLLKYAQRSHLQYHEHHEYVMLAFAFAFLTSVGVLLARRGGGAGGSRWRHLAGGALLGVCNYTALFCLTRVLSLAAWESSVVFPVYSVGVVVVSAVLAALLFAEPLPPRRLWGIGAGLAAVVLLSL